IGRENQETTVQPQTTDQKSNHRSGTLGSGPRRLKSAKPSRQDKNIHARKFAPEPNHEPPFSSADCKQQVYHPNDFVRTAQDEDSPSARLFQNQPKTTHLVVVVRPKIRFLPKKLHEQLR